MYVKGLGETYMTLDKRLVLLLLYVLFLLLFLLRLIKTKPGEASNVFKVVYIFDAETIQRRNVFVVESACCIIHAFLYK